ncbi:hypothetical protein FACS189491_05420 [Spirochaetia bacterium]|nr:hypothetical protein FACS189491_05420 [Spirochaetia bacterium]
MSRSYRKFPSRYLEYLLSWSKIRMKERQCIYKEIRCVEYGDVLFNRPKDDGNTD